ncbi:hypothetical protein M426DRAFT_324410 [Hypoxylon sp. CI-4A]|nr:hypothetical protein M426DRAFT_324410 [Hypoxylon sp. CI-4A]
MATSIVSVAYPKGGKFDMEYYVKKHMPFVQLKWSPFGLKAWRVAHYTNPESPYIAQAWLEFVDEPSWAKASVSNEAKEIFSDIPSYTDATPVVLTGTIPEAKTW